jgi:hypothetical protein
MPFPYFPSSIYRDSDGRRLRRLRRGCSHAGEPLCRWRPQGRTPLRRPRPWQQKQTGHPFFLAEVLRVPAGSCGHDRPTPCYPRSRLGSSTPATRCWAESSLPASR